MKSRKMKIEKNDIFFYFYMVRACMKPFLARCLLEQV